MTLMPGSGACRTFLFNIFRTDPIRPSSEEPAWKITGWPCGERWMFSGPSTWKKRPGRPARRRWRPFDHAPRDPAQRAPADPDRGIVRLGCAFFTLATLSFLRLGIQPPSADWGLAIADGYGFLTGGAWWVVAFNAGAIISLVVATNLVTDGLGAFEA